jgi:YfiH family protein
MQPLPIQTAVNGVEYLPVPAWAQTSWLWHGFSTRRGGLSSVYTADGTPSELNLGFTQADDRETVAQNRRLLAEAITGSAETSLITVRQIHSSLTIRVGDRDAAPAQPCEGDGLITDEPGVLLAIQTADCIPVLVADSKKRVVAAFHAGWRGTVQRIVDTGVERMRQEFGCQPEDLVAAIGPGIGACCYAVGEEVVSSFESQFSYGRELFRQGSNADASPTSSNPHLDLTEANRRQLLSAGLDPSAIQVVGGCTSCHPELFYSHRASQGHAGRMLSVIGIRE